jgi:hypothetical protein
MFSSLLLAGFAASSLAADQFFMSYQPNDTTGSYEPLFIECGTSCSDCGEGAKPCFADSFSNLCYEPKLGETCCRDSLGSTCDGRQVGNVVLTCGQRAATTITIVRTMHTTSGSAAQRCVKQFLWI